MKGQTSLIIDLFMDFQQTKLNTWIWCQGSNNIGIRFLFVCLFLYFCLCFFPEISVEWNAGPYALYTFCKIQLEDNVFCLDCVPFACKSPCTTGGWGNIQNLDTIGETLCRLWFKTIIATLPLEIILSCLNMTRNHFTFDFVFQLFLYVNISVCAAHSFSKKKSLKILDDKKITNPYERKKKKSYYPWV